VLNTLRRIDENVPAAAQIIVAVAVGLFILTLVLWALM
jgi:hypothetical protein